MGRYAIFNGLVYGGGTDVIPNPEGTPTDELHSLQIGDDIYEIVGGGGSGEGYSETLLYKYENGTTVDGIKTLNDDITNYDLLLFRLVFNVPTYTDHIISVSALEQVGYIPSPVATGPHVSIVSYASDYIRIVEGETKNKINIFEINGNEYIDEIYGIKIEGGSSSGGGNASLDATTLYDTPITSTGTYTLADDYNNYDFIGFKAGNGSTETDIRLYAVKDIQDSMNDNLIITNNVTNSWFNFTINANELTIPGKTVSTIYSVIGYKIKGGGSSTVVPNPQEEPTDTLNTVEIDGVVYNIEGGSEGGQGLNPANYSTEEEVIGVWTNNLPVYKKTWTFSSVITVGSNSWADTSISVNDTQIHTIVNCEAVGPNGQAWTCISATTDEATQTYVRILNTRDTNVNVKHLTLYYIKDGDSPIVPPGAKGEYNYYGGFIDTSNVIQNRIIFHSETSYTATENCAVIWSVANNTSTSMNVLIDGVLVAGMYADTIAQPTNFIFLKKNQTITFRPSYSSGDNSYAVYGIMYDNEKIIEGEGVEIYSEDEYIVGKWIDGKKLYQKTYHLAQAITVAGGGTWTDTGIDISDVNILVDSKFSQDIAVWDAINGINDNGTLKATILASGSLTVDTITLRYTKTVETPAPAWGGSVTNNYANFIDTDNVIDSGSYQGSFTYTATEDCFVNVAVVMSANDSATITIDGAVVTSGWCASLNTINPILPLKKGQTLVATASASNTSNYTVYGISYSSGGSSSGSKIEYSTEEKEVGTWIDGSKIYQKTFVLSSFTSGTITINASDLNIKSLVDANGEADFIQNGEIVESLKFPHYISGQANSTIRMAFGNIQILHTGLNEYTSGYVTVRYTKTTT